MSDCLKSHKIVNFSDNIEGFLIRKMALLVISIKQGDALFLLGINRWVKHEPSKKRRCGFEKARKKRKPDDSNRRVVYIKTRALARPRAYYTHMRCGRVCIRALAHISNACVIYYRWRFVLCYAVLNVREVCVCVYMCEMM